MRGTVWVVAVALAGCPSAEPHECDGGTPTCDSSLLVLLPDGRAEFRLTVDLGTVVLPLTCPNPDGDLVVQEYTATCGAGQATVRTNLAFPDHVDVQLEDTQPVSYTPDYQEGGDFCGNPCTVGRIQL